MPIPQQANNNGENMTNKQLIMGIVISEILVITVLLTIGLLTFKNILIAGSVAFICMLFFYGVHRLIDIIDIIDDKRD